MSEPNHNSERPGAAVFAALFLLASVLLLSQLGEQAKFSAKSKLFAQPAFWPGVGVAGMTVFGLFHLIGAWRKRTGGAMTETAIWLRSLEYLAWFMAYVFAVPVISYLLASVIFATALALRAGYRGPRMLGAAALTALGIVLVFKTLLSVKIPGGAVYEYLPDGLRNLAIVNF